MNQNICWIGVDWGITHLRCYALNDEGNLLDRASSKDGIYKIKDAINKLKELRILSCDLNGLLTVPDLNEALMTLDLIWDDSFKFKRE